MQWSFLTVSNPVAMWGLLAVIIPIVIHLLSKNKGKVIVFAAMQFITKTDAVTLNQIKLQEWLLLLIRVLLVICSVMVLAKVFFDADKAFTPAKKHVYLSPLWLKHSAVADKQNMLKGEGDSQFYLLNKKGSALSAEQILAWSATEGLMADNAWLSARRLLSQHTRDITQWQQSNPQQRISVYSTNIVAEFSGDKVSLPFNVQWHVLDAAQQSENSFGDQRLLSPQLLLLNQNEPKLITSFTAVAGLLQEHTPLTANISTLSLPRARDGIAIDRFTRELTKVTDNLLANDEADDNAALTNVWLFYLSQQPLTDEQGELTSLGTELMALVSKGAQLVMLASHVSASKWLAGELISSHGKTSLSHEPLFTPVSIGKGQVYTVNGFDSWQQWSQQAEFAQWIYSLLMTPLKLKENPSRTSLTKAQILPWPPQKTEDNQQQNIAAISINEHTENEQSFWLVLLVLLWSIERLYSEFSLRRTQATFTKGDS